MINENKYKEGEVVRDRSRPDQKLVVGRVLNNIYYCKVPEDIRRKELVYLERDLMGDKNV